MRAFISACVLAAGLWQLPVAAGAAVQITGYGPYRLGRSYALDDLPAGFQREPDQQFEGHRVETVSTLDTLTFGNQTYEGTVTLFQLDGTLALIEVTLPLARTADRRKVRRFVRDLREQTLERYTGAVVLVDGFQEHYHFHRGHERHGGWGGRLIITEAADPPAQPSGNILGVFAEDDGITLLYSTPRARTLLFDGGLSDDEISAGKL